MIKDRRDAADNLQNVSYCGLYCRTCSTRSRLPKTATALRDTMAKDGWPLWGEHAMPDFGTFWTVLNKLADFAETCPDCRGGCGNPACEIRQCAVERKIDLCPECEAYPCEHVAALARRYPTLIADGERLAEIGVEPWVAEQKERGATGFCYCDIRFPEVPDQDEDAS